MKLTLSKEELKGFIAGLTLAYKKCCEVDKSNCNDDIQLLKVIYLRMISELNSKLLNLTTSNIKINEELAKMQFTYERTKLIEEQNKLLEEDLVKDIIN